MKFIIILPFFFPVLVSFTNNETLEVSQNYITEFIVCFNFTVTMRKYPHIYGVECTICNPIDRYVSRKIIIAFESQLVARCNRQLYLFIENSGSFDEQRHETRIGISRVCRSGTGAIFQAKTWPPFPRRRDSLKFTSRHRIG